MPTTELLLRAAVDQSAAAQGVQALKAIQNAADGAANALLSINEDAAKSSQELKRLQDVSKLIGRGDSIDELARQFGRLGEVTGDFDTQLIHLRRSLHEVGASEGEIKRATAAFLEFQDAANGGGKLNIGLSSLGRTGSALNQLGLGAVGEPIQAVANVGQVVQELKSLSGGLASIGNPASLATSAISGLAGPIGVVGAAAGLAAPAILLAGAAISEFIRIIEEGKKQIEAASDAQVKYFEFIATHTSEDAQKRIEQDKVVRDANERGIGILQEQIAAKLRGAGASEADIGTALKEGKSPAGTQFDVYVATESLFEQIKKLKEASNSAATDIDALTNGIKNGDFATNDAIAAEKKLQEERNKSADDAINRAKQSAQLLESGTSKGVESMIAQIKAERESVGNILRSDSGLSIDKINELNKRFVELGNSEKDLTDHILPLIKAHEAQAKAVEDAKKALDSFQDSLKKAADIGREISKMEADRAEQVQRQQEDDARQSERRGTEEDYRQRIAAAKREEAEQQVRDKLLDENKAADIKANDERAKIDQDYFSHELKAYANYIEAEKLQTDRANLQRLQTLEKAQLDLRTLAARGDVAGFVTRSNQAKLDLKQQADTADLATRDRQADYEKGVQEARDARQKQLDDLEASLERERQAREQAAEQRIAEIEAQAQESNSKSAQLEAELNDIREQWRRDDLQRQRDMEAESYEERLQVQRDKQAEAIAEAVSFFQQWQDAATTSVVEFLNSVILNATAQAGGAAQPTTASEPIDYGTNPYQPGYFAGGHPYIPHDDYPAILHEGERVLTRRENADYSAGGGSRRGGDTYNIQIDATVGDVATKTFVEETAGVLVTGIKQSLIKSKGRGNNG